MTRSPPRSRGILMVLQTMAQTKSLPRICIALGLPDVPNAVGTRPAGSGGRGDSSWNSVWITWTIRAAARRRSADSWRSTRTESAGHLPAPPEPRQIQRQHRRATGGAGPGGTQWRAGDRRGDRDGGGRRRPTESVPRARAGGGLVSQFRSDAADGHGDVAGSCECRRTPTRWSLRRGSRRTTCACWRRPRRCRSTRLVVLAMGELGFPTRVLSPVFGGVYTYAAPMQAEGTAAGPGERASTCGTSTGWRSWRRRPRSTA